MPSNPAFLCEGELICASCVQMDDEDLATGHVSVRKPSDITCDDACSYCGETFARESEVDVDNMLQQCLETLLWSETDEDGEPLDDRFEVHDIPLATRDEISSDCQNFVEMYGHLLTEDEEQNSENVGHNFALNRNGHGAGFWDGDYCHGGALSDGCKSFGPIHLYVTDDGELDSHS